MKLSDRMKQYESVFKQVLIPRVPIIARIDGKAFHSYTKNLERPYDKRLSKLMGETTKYLIAETHARLGYTQSDEISLYFNYGVESDMLFSGKLFKLQSVIASMATAYFNTSLYNVFDYGDLQVDTGYKLAMFDCRVFQVPNLDEARNYFLWRERDAVKNSISMARSRFIHISN